MGDNIVIIKSQEKEHGAHNQDFHAILNHSYASNYSGLEKMQSRPIQIDEEVRETLKGNSKVNEQADIQLMSNHSQATKKLTIVDTDKHYVATSLTKHSFQNQVSPDSRDNSTGSGHFYGITGTSQFRRRKKSSHLVFNGDVITNQQITVKSKIYNQTYEEKIPNQKIRDHYSKQTKLSMNIQNMEMVKPKSAYPRHKTTERQRSVDKQRI